MKATWTMKAGLSVIGQHTPGNPRHWTVSAWAALPDGTKERVTVRPKGKCTLYDLIPAISGGVAVQLDCVVI
jgi:hypothetical protein